VPTRAPGTPRRPPPEIAFGVWQVDQRIRHRFPQRKVERVALVAFECRRVVARIGGTRLQHAVLEAGVLEVAGIEQHRAVGCRVAQSTLLDRANKVDDFRYVLRDASDGHRRSDTQRLHVAHELELELIGQ